MVEEGKEGKDAQRYKDQFFLPIHTSISIPRFEDIPCPPGLPLLGHLPLLLRRENAENMPRFAAELRAEYGDIVR